MSGEEIETYYPNSILLMKFYAYYLFFMNIILFFAEYCVCEMESYITIISKRVNSSLLRKLSSLELINTFVLVNSDILLERERERERERRRRLLYTII